MTAHDTPPSSGLAASTSSPVVTDPPYGDTSLEWDRTPDGRWLELVSLCASGWCFSALSRFWLTEAVYSSAGTPDLWPAGGRLGEAQRVWLPGRSLQARSRAGGSLVSGREAIVRPQGSDGHCAIRRRVPRKKGRPAHMGHIEAAPYFSEDGGPRLMRAMRSGTSVQSTGGRFIRRRSRSASCGH